MSIGRSDEAEDWACKRGDHRRRRTVRRIECGDGEDGEPDLSLPGWKSYASRMRRIWVRCSHEGVSAVRTPFKLAPARLK